MLGKNAARAAPMLAFAAFRTILGSDDIGPLLEHFRRQTHAQLVQQRGVVQARAVREPLRLGSDQQDECVRLRRARLLELRAERLRLCEQRLDLRHVQPRHGADLEAALEDAQRLLARLDGVAGDQDALVDLAQSVDSRWPPPRRG